MKNIIEEFRNELINHYKAFRFSHYALHNLGDVYKDWKSNHPELKNFVIEDQDFNITIRFNEAEISETEEKGLYQRILAGSTIATFYNIWKDKYRKKIAEEKGVEKNDIKIELFYELNKIRQAVIHNNFNKTSKLKDLELLSFILIDNTFKLGSSEVEKIYQLLLLELDSLSA